MISYKNLPIPDMFIGKITRISFKKSFYINGLRYRIYEMITFKQNCFAVYLEDDEGDEFADLIGVYFNMRGARRAIEKHSILDAIKKARDKNVNLFNKYYRSKLSTENPSTVVSVESGKIQPVCFTEIKDTLEEVSDNE